MNPNLLTILSFFCTSSALLLSYSTYLSNSIHFVIAILTFLYLLLDHLDGMQAKRLGGGSALGEYLDHFLDVINSAIFLMILKNLYIVENEVILLLAFSAVYFSQFAVFYEQQKTGCLIFGRFESFEALTILILLFTLTGFEQGQQLVNFMVGKYRLIEWFLIISAILNLFMSMQNIWRIRLHLVEFGLLTTAISFLVIITELFELAINSFWLVACLATPVIEECLSARLTGKRSWMYKVLPMLFLVTFSVLNIEPAWFLVVVIFLVSFKFSRTAILLKKCKHFPQFSTES